MSTGTLSPVGPSQFFTDAGLVANGYLLYTYTAGTTTPATTYFDNSLLPASANTNPIVLDTAGRCVIYLAATSYKFILKTDAGVPVWTQDNIAATNAGSSGLGAIFSFGSNSSSPITVTSYASGATFDTLQPGSAVYTEDSANLTGTYKLRATGVTSTTNTLTVAIVDLSDGAPDTPLATCAISSTTGAVVTSSAITWPAGGSTKSYGIKTKVDSGSAYLMGVTLVRTA